MRVRHYRTLRVLTFNARVGIALKNGGLKWVLRRNRGIDIVLIQEGRGIQYLRSELGPGWHILPRVQPGKSKRTQAMTYVCFRKSRFDVLLARNKNIRYGSKYPRRMTAATVKDRRTGQVLAVASVHPDPLGRGFMRALPGALTKHVRQVKAYVDFFEEQPTDTLLLAMGDFNEVLRTSVSKDTARDQFGKVGMVPLFTKVKNPGYVRLDDLFARFDRDLKPVSRKSITVPVKGMDHPAVLATLKVRRK